MIESPAPQDCTGASDGSKTNLGFCGDVVFISGGEDIRIKTINQSRQWCLPGLTGLEIQHGS